MASKLQFISELASHTAQTVTRDVDGWKQYLTTASRLYKQSCITKIKIRYAASS